MSNKLHQIEYGSATYSMCTELYVQQGTAFCCGQCFANFHCTSFKTNTHCDTE